MNPEVKKEILKAQGNEITEYFIYKKLAQRIKKQHNKKILLKIAKEEKEHHDFWKKYTKTEVKPSKIKLWWFYFISLIF